MYLREICRLTPYPVQREQNCRDMIEKQEAMKTLNGNQKCGSSGIQNVVKICTIESSI